ncbi:MAG: hypothetical protein JHC93_08095 [Parachlamydiales bacterium]|nr:hypothetical protein [Parachlamydiales bacterium]
MNSILSKSLASIIASLSLYPLWSFNGLVPIGYGAKSESLAGAVTANPQDSLTVFSNPAGLGFLESGWDLGISAKNFPNSYFTYSYIYLGGPGRLDAENTIFIMPYAGLNKSLTANQKIALAFYNEKYQTKYSQSYVGVGYSPLEFSINQSLLGLGWSYRINDNHSFGVTLLGSLLCVNFKGLEKLDIFSYKEGFVTNKGDEYSIGGGLRLGWLSCFFDRLWLGASYSTKIYQTPFHKYQGFINGGRIDLPSNLGFSLRYEFDRINIAAEYQLVFNDDVLFLSNTSDIEVIGDFGDENNTGMGWRNQPILKISFDCQLNHDWQIKLGAMMQRPLYTDNNFDYNTMTLGVIEYWVTSGIKYQIDERREINLSYVRGLKNEKTGRSTLGYGALTEVSSENILGISFNQTF